MAVDFFRNLERGNVYKYKKIKKFFKRYGLKHKLFESYDVSFDVT